MLFSFVCTAAVEYTTYCTDWLTRQHIELSWSQIPTPQAQVWDIQLQCFYSINILDIDNIISDFNMWMLNARNVSVYHWKQLIKW